MSEGNSIDLCKYDRLIGKLLAMAKDGDHGAMTDAFVMCRSLEREGATFVAPNGHNEPDIMIPNSETFEKAHGYNKQLRGIVAGWLRNGYEVRKLDTIYKRTLLFDAPWYFDEFCRVLEYNRPKEKKFYEPRRKQLLPIVNALQDLADNKLDLLAISCPPGVGKTTLAEFFLAFIGGRDPDKPNLCGSHSNSFLAGVYNEMIRILDPCGEYLYNEIFPYSRMVHTNAMDMRIDLNTRKRFQTYEFSSIGSGNAGKVRAANLLYCDDLVDGIETAMSKERLDKLWQQYYTDLRQRKIGTCRELHIATRWSIHDPIGRLEEQYADDSRCKFIRFPAIDENGESLWDYPYNLGFSTEFYKEQQEIMDDASWNALYMSTPIERDALLFSSDEFRRYFELPNREPDAIIAVCDTADSGGDSYSMPIAYQYGNDYYIDEWIFDSSKPEIVEERIVRTLIERKVKTAQFESNRGGGRIADNIQKMVKERGGFTHITKAWSQTNKNTRIIVTSGAVKTMLLFKDESLYKTNKEYAKAMRELCSYSMVGGRANEHDDAADSLSMLINYIESLSSGVVSVMKRSF